MAKDESAEKTEKPTPKRLKEARRQGQVARSAEIGTWMAMLAAPSLIGLTASRGAQLTSSIALGLPNMNLHDAAPAVSLLGHSLGQMVLVVLPIGIVMSGIGVASGAAQGGVTIAWKAAKPKFSRLNPFTGFKNIYGARGAWEAVKMITKLTFLTILAVSAVRRVIPVLLGSGVMPLSVVVDTVASTATQLIRGVAGAGLMLAAADYAQQRRMISKQVKMSKQEIKEEMKQSEGNPEIRRAVRQRQFQMSRNRMMRDVATADVILVNPTHVAVALTYSADQGAPRVVAKGADEIARQIREIGTDNRIPIVRHVPLARALYAACDVGQEIPPDLYVAVARILAFLFTLRQRGRSTAGEFGDAVLPALGPLPPVA